jgi:hypothetical protein
LVGSIPAKLSIACLNAATPNNPLPLFHVYPAFGNLSVSFSSEGYFISSLFFARAGFHCTCLTRLMQNLSFVIVPLKTACIIAAM